MVNDRCIFKPEAYAEDDEGVGEHTGSSSKEETPDVSTDSLPSLLSPPSPRSELEDEFLTCDVPSCDDPSEDPASGTDCRQGDGVFDRTPIDADGCSIHGRFGAGDLGEFDRLIASAPDEHVL